MKTTIVCVSEAHGNTRRVADAIGGVLGARIVEPGSVDAADLATNDVIGFGSGIFYLGFHKRLHRFIDALPEGQRAKAFVFATSGFPAFFGSMVRLLESKGFEVIGTFSCRAYDDWFPLKIVGGVNKGRPNASDLKSAKAFAESLKIVRSGVK